MTEAEWMACEGPGGLLKELQGRASDRKLRLFAAACCRRDWPFLVDERSQKAVEAIERHADDSLPPAEWEQVRRDARLGFLDARSWMCRDAQAPRTAECAAAKAVWHATELNAWGAAGAASYQSANAARRAAAADFSRTFAQACHLLARFLRDIFGNPFRHMAFDPAWLTSTVTALAQTMYESRDFGAMPILADALQDAGCDSDDILHHLRGPGPHVRGCWVVDLVLGKT